MVNKSRMMQIAAMLEEQKGPEWVTAALNAINQESMAYLGGDGPPGTNSAQDLARIYRVRLERSKVLGIKQYGCAELIARLEALNGNEIIEVWPFANSNSETTAFLKDGIFLIGCITFSD